ncbi:MAG: ribonuclease HII [Clostridiales bacterium]|nr:ribonuclease HII [Clostridiales bacterium]
MNEAERDRLLKLSERETELRSQGYLRVAGLDEAGRGPLAGPVVAAAVVLPPGLLLRGLNDSKKVSPGNRYRLEEEIKAYALDWGIGEASHLEIDEINILNATRLAMGRAIDALREAPAYLLLDAVQLSISIPQEGMIKGDEKVACISAASILAKTYRDRQMEGWDALYPVYGFKQNKGYPTAAHRAAVFAEGPCPIHRKTFLKFLAKPSSGGVSVR